MLNKNKFLIYLTGILLLTVGLIVFCNYFIDIYGLFRGKKERVVTINERTSKYLFSFRYIPENFEGFIIGPSLSANLNPENIKSHKVYNASMMGANISELDYLVDNILAKGKMKFVVVCLDPYLTKDFGRKSANIDPKEYWGALGCTNLLKTYFLYFVRKYNLLPHKYSSTIYNSSGWNNFELEMKNLDAEKAIKKMIAIKAPESTYIHPEAYVQLQKTLEKLRSHDVKVVAYFSPVPYELYKMGEKDYKIFEAKISALFDSRDILINLNEEVYKYATSDYSMYIDHGHLSAKGQNFVLTELQESL